MSILYIVLVGALFFPSFTSAQIPTVCSDAESLENLRCCPTTADGVCGVDSGRGQCVQVDVDGYSTESSDVRANWPHYYTEFCQCSGNYSGYDCSRCKFGYYGESCDQFQVLPRRPIATYSDDEWAEFIDILIRSRQFESDYHVVLEETVPGNTSLRTSNVTLYKLYVWMHHYAAKDGNTLDATNRIDYAHFGPAFTTWHRYKNLWLEWELQYMLKTMGDPEYYNFRLPYWDFRREIQKSSGIPVEELFSETRFGATVNVTGFPRVIGNITSKGWDSICWNTYTTICDPNISTGPLQRCPFTGLDPCNSDNPDWPTLQDINTALDIDEYDSPPYNLLSTTGYRSFVDFKVDLDYERCRSDRMCLCAPLGDPQCDISMVPPNVTMVALTGQMHTVAHFIPGCGDVAANLPENERGQIEDFSGSPNDPYFILLHAMIDCMLEEWLARHPDAEYPSDIPVTPPTMGHQPDDYVVPFIPLYTNAAMFKRAYNFGYSCRLPNITTSGDEISMATTTESGGVKTAHYIGFVSSFVITLVNLVVNFVV